MESVFECGTCNKPYDDYIHKPLSLPCGHVFCQDCLLKQPSDLSCPIDKFRFDLQVFSLPCCYTILANLPKQSIKDSCCIRHPKKKVKFMCKSHDKFLCTECVIDHTGAGHNIVSFTVNSAAVKSDLKELEHICEVTIQDYEENWKEIETRHRSVKDFYHGQINKINLAYENAVKVLQSKKRELVGVVSKQLMDQCKIIEKHKETIGKVIESSGKVMSQVKLLQADLPHYESLCLTIKSLKQELKYLEQPIEALKIQYFAFKSSEPFSISCGQLEELDDFVEIENQIVKAKGKHCCHSNKAVLQASNLNEPALPPCKSASFKQSEKVTPRPEDRSIENKSPEKTDKCCKNRQNINQRNHPKRMPWKKRNRSL